MKLTSANSEPVHWLVSGQTLWTSHAPVRILPLVSCVAVALVRSVIVPCHNPAPAPCVVRWHQPAAAASRFGCMWLHDGRGCCRWRVVRRECCDLSRKSLYLYMGVGSTGVGSMKE